MKHLLPALCLLVLLAACSGSGTLSPDEGEKQQARQVTIFQSRDSQKKWELYAEEVNFENTSHAVLLNPRLLLRENGQDSAEITGKRGTLNYDDKLVSIEGNAHIRSYTQQAELATDRFFYDLDKDRVWSDKKTLVTRGGTQITARGGIETDSKLRKIQFKKQSTQLPQDIRQLQEAVQ